MIITYQRKISQLITQNETMRMNSRRAQKWMKNIFNSIQLILQELHPQINKYNACKGSSRSFEKQFQQLLQHYQPSLINIRLMKQSQRQSQRRQAKNGQLSSYDFLSNSLRKIFLQSQMQLLQKIKQLMEQIEETEKKLQKNYDIQDNQRHIIRRLEYQLIEQNLITDKLKIINDKKMHQLQLEIQDLKQNYDKLRQTVCITRNQQSTIEIQRQISQNLQHEGEKQFLIRRKKQSEHVDQLKGTQKMKSEAILSIQEIERVYESKKTKRV